MNRMPFLFWLRVGCLVLIWTLFLPIFWTEAAPAPTRRLLPNGLIALHLEQKELPIVSVFLTLRAGVTAEPAAKAGLANLTAQLLAEGTEKRDAVELSQAIDTLGGRVACDAARETMACRLTLLRDDFETGLRLLAEMILRPVFPDTELRRKVQQIIGQIERDLQNPATQARIALHRALYGDHPYGRRIVGSVETLQTLARQDVLQFHRDYYQPQGAIVAVVGDISSSEATRLLRDVFGDWKGRPRALPEHPPTGFPDRLQVKKIQRDVAQAHVLFGHPGLSRRHPDYYAVQVMNHILGGGGLGSRLANQIREQKGLAYSAWSHFSAGLTGGIFQAGFDTRNATLNQAMQVLFDELHRIREAPVSDQELADAKSFITGNFLFDLAETRDLASLLTDIELFTLGLDYLERFPHLIRAVTREDVQRVARQHIQPRKGILVILADMDKLPEGLPQ